MSDRFLSTPLRRALERTIKEARAVAEEAASDAIRRLGVADAKPPPYLDGTGQELRRRLRAHGRALAADDTQTTDRLIEATAYEHWHRRLFARFLAERHLLRHPEHDVLVTLEDCKEFAAEEGLADEWAAAEAYASKMLPAVFRPEDPVLELEFSPEHELKLRQLVLGIDAEAFQADDALGWTYQYWRALEKDRVNKAGGKIGAAELPAVTQLFTEPYMVRFLLHNTLGAWWAGKVLAVRPELAADAPDEASLRAAVSLPGYEFDMLRLVKEGDDAPRWRPAAGTFDAWPAQAEALTVLDPCCGSGHFLTEALTILAALRQQEEGLSAAESVTAVLRDNLFGLELDGRCVQIAAFAVALAAWKAGGFQSLPIPQVAWVGAPPPLPRREFSALANGDAELAAGLQTLWDLFDDAPLLGSLIEPLDGDLASDQRVARLRELVDDLVERSRAAEPDRREGVLAARGMADAVYMLASRYTLIVTNVPFLGRGKQTAVLREYLEQRFPAAKNDLATAMLSRIVRWLEVGGAAGVVTPQSWLFMTTYEQMRLQWLETVAFRGVASLGFKAFSGNPTWDFPTALTIFETSPPSLHTSFFGLEVRDAVDAAKKSVALAGTTINLLVQEAQFRNPDVRIATSAGGDIELLSARAGSYVGLQNGDTPRWVRRFWEPVLTDGRWALFQGTSSTTTHFSGRTDALLWEGGAGTLVRSEGVFIKGREAWGKQGVIIRHMGDLPAGLYDGDLYDQSSAVIIPFNQADLPAVWAYCSSGDFNRDVRQVDQALKVTNATLVKVPFDRERWARVAAENYPNGLPEPYSDDPTQWLFHGHSAGAEPGLQLQVALARLVGYRWPAELLPEMRLSAAARSWVAKNQGLPVADPDGLVTIPAAGGDRPLADRLREHLAASFGAEWNERLEARLVAEADERLDNKSNKDRSLDAWLRNRAFRQHCKLFHDRPFLWQVWDGQKDGFSAFLHYHRLDRATLQKLTYTVLGDWIARRKAEGDDRRIEAASILQSKLAAILEGETPYDIFVRWKPPERQPLGWDPDLDDGVRLNIRPWVEAGVLRENPKIKWGVDRGTDPASAPWYELFQGKRNNDHHTTLAEKRAARAAKSATAA